MRAPKLKKFVSNVKQRIGTRAERVDHRQTERTKIVASRQKGKSQRTGYRQGGKTERTGSRQGGKTERTGIRQWGWTERTGYRQAGKSARKGERIFGRDFRKGLTRATEEGVAYDPQTGGMEDWSGGFMESDYGAIDEPITEKAWFWPALIGGAAMIIFTMKKK